MYKKFILLLLCLVVLLSYNAVEKQKEQILFGNWYPYRDSGIKLEDMVYKEQYFSTNEYSFYEEILSMPYEYYVKGRKVYYVNLYGKDSVCLGSIDFLNKNMLKIEYENSKRYFILRRVIDSNTLEDFVTQKIDEKTYYPSYLKRENYWKKYGVLPENGDFNTPPQGVDQ